MPLEAPNLDDRQYADIVNQAIKLIPRYAPEWTDHNPSDPGITLVQLFAWMTEMMLYRLNQVPELHYIKFLQLLGIEAKPAQPARAEVTFTLARTDIDYTIVPLGSQLAAAEGGPDGRPLIFETDAALIAIGAILKAVQSFDGFGYTVETSKNQAVDQSFYPFGPYAREGSALLLGFESPLPFTRQQVELAFFLPPEERSAREVHCDLDLGTLPPPALLVWEYWTGAFWDPLSLTKDETRAFSRSGHVFFAGPGDKVKRAQIGEVPDNLYWIRARVQGATYEQAPRLNSVLTNTARVTQAVTERDEVLGGSDGTANQIFSLANRPVVVRDQPLRVTGADDALVEITSLRLEIDEGAGFQVWQEVDDFLDSSPNDPHFILNHTTGQIRFGDGENGRIPLANVDNPDGNIVAREYRHGGGRQGNVPANGITELQTFAEAVDSVTNLLPAEGGSDEETVEEAKARAPRELKSKSRAVTAEDFETLALATPGVRVRRAKALPLRHPKFPDAPIPGVVSVIVVPEADVPNPLPNESTLHTVCAHLNIHRLLTSEVYVIPPVYRRVEIEVDLIARPEADLAEVKDGVESSLLRFLHPLTGGAEGQGWEFGRDVFYTDIYREILKTPGVDRIDNNQLVIWLDNERHDFCRDVPIGDGVLVYSTEHQIRVSYAART